MGDFKSLLKFVTKVWIEGFCGAFQIVYPWSSFQIKGGFFLFFDFNAFCEEFQIWF